MSAAASGVWSQVGNVASRVYTRAGPARASARLFIVRGTDGGWVGLCSATRDGGDCLWQLPLAVGSPKSHSFVLCVVLWCLLIGDRGKDPESKAGQIHSGGAGWAGRPACPAGPPACPAAAASAMTTGMIACFEGLPADHGSEACSSLKCSTSDTTASLGSKVAISSHSAVTVEAAAPFSSGSN